MVKKRIVLISCIVGALSLPIFGQSLDDNLLKAQENSDTISSLEIAKQQTLLSLQLGDIDSKISYSISPGSTVSFDNSSKSQTYLIGGKNNGNLVNIVIPGSHKRTSENDVTDSTVIGIGANVGFMNYTGKGMGYEIAPSVNAQHTFLHGEYNNLKKDLSDQLTLISANQSYEKGLIQYKKQIIKLTKSFIENEKNVKDTENKINKLEKKIDDSLSLEQYSKESVAYKKDIVELDSLKNVIDSLLFQRSNLEQNYLNYTGTDYIDISEIRIPNLEISKTNEESLSLQQAKLSVQLAQNTIDEVEREKNRSNLVLSGGLNSRFASYTTSLSGNNYNDPNLSFTPSVALTYNADNFSVDGGMSISSSYNDGTLTASPSFTVGGTWRNDTTSDLDIIANQKNEKTLIEKQIQLNTVVQAKTLEKMQNKNNIDSWNFNYKQYQSSKKLLEDNLDLANKMFDLGLASQSEVDDAQFNLNQSNYDELIILLDGISLELDLQTMQL